MHEVNCDLITTVNSFAMAYVKPNVNQERYGRREMQCVRTKTNYIITHTGEDDRRGTVKTLKEQGEQQSMLNACYPNISDGAGFGSLRDKKVEKKKSGG